MASFLELGGLLAEDLAEMGYLEEAAIAAENNALMEDVMYEGSVQYANPSYAGAYTAGAGAAALGAGAAGASFLPSRKKRKYAPPPHQIPLPDDPEWPEPTSGPDLKKKSLLKMEVYQRPIPKRVIVKAPRERRKYYGLKGPLNEYTEQSAVVTDSVENSADYQRFRINGYGRLNALLARQSYMNEAGTTGVMTGLTTDGKGDNVVLQYKSKGYLKIANNYAYPAKITVHFCYTKSTVNTEPDVLISQGITDKYAVADATESSDNINNTLEDSRKFFQHFTPYRKYQCVLQPGQYTRFMIQTKKMKNWCQIDYDDTSEYMQGHTQVIIVRQQGLLGHNTAATSVGYTETKLDMIFEEVYKWRLRSTLLLPTYEHTSGLGTSITDIVTHTTEKHTDVNPGND
jgi:hypothetical protein